MKRILLLMMILLVTFLAACSDDDQTSNVAKERVTAVETMKATKGDLKVAQSTFGRTEASRTTPIMLQTPGEVADVQVKEGDHVKKDDTLFTLKTPAGNQTIKATKDGEIISLKAKEADMVSNEEPAIIIADTDTMQINFAVTGKMRQHFKVDRKFTTYYEDEKYEATITSVGHMPNDQGLYPIEATVKNDKGHLLTGSLVEIDIPVKKVSDAIIVPTAAIVEEDDEAFVYVVNDGTVEKVNVTIKETQSDQTAIEGKVKKGDQVVVTGQLTLSDKSKVNVVKESGE
ncbi:efflux RND transporter periplasmic adaptor subunit [Virgibacillus soli]|uniref:Efflux RND transporter periplasmic adaptor subunit n=1 Tax=Paracerasibacillus soli TaxID=480284 RepID=A0ABU5CT90_9BACI|nr:efflux RND transporter periplasmic adaptor subunit [Virgibacillus soli]MDY0409460.1 efflux RND transporter periplasmic adaptor subunit [Virgibacillus soli]